MHLFMQVNQKLRCYVSDSVCKCQLVQQRLVTKVHMMQLHACFKQVMYWWQAFKQGTSQSALCHVLIMCLKAVTGRFWVKGLSAC